MTIPKTLAETVPALDEMLSDEAKQQIADCESAEEVEDLIVSAHHGLGQTLRNKWGLWSGNDELKGELRAAGITHPDDMSHYILKHYCRSKVATRHQRIAQDD